MPWQENPTEQKITRKINWKRREGNPKKQAKLSNFSQKHAQYACSRRLKQQKCHKIWKKCNLQNRNLQKTSPKPRKFQLKQVPKQEIRKFSQKRNSTRKQAQICGKTARMAKLVSAQRNVSYISYKLYAGYHQKGDFFEGIFCLCLENVTHLFDPFFSYQTMVYEDSSHIRCWWSYLAK